MGEDQAIDSPSAAEAKEDVRLRIIVIVWKGYSGYSRPERDGKIFRQYPDPSTCWRRLREWYEADVLKDMWRAFLSELDHNGILDWDEVFVDATFFPAKKGARESGIPSGERERSAWYWSMARVFLSEAIPTLPRQLRSRSLIRLLERSESPNEDPDDPGPDRSE